MTVYSSLLQDLEQKQQELDALTTRIQNLEDVSTFPNFKMKGEQSSDTTLCATLHVAHWFLCKQFTFLVKFTYL